MEAFMNRTRFVSLLAGAVVACTAAAFAAGQASSTAQSLGSVTLPHSVMADGQRLAAGTYMLRLTGDSPQSVVGESPDSERWVEFVQGKTVKGREVATVVPKDQIKDIAKGDQPGAGSHSVELLKGDDYYRVWFNKSGMNYLIHLKVAK
jgi:hypothetical protein